jgi:hypothetical protein
MDRVRVVLSVTRGEYQAYLPAVTQAWFKLEWPVTVAFVQGIEWSDIPDCNYGKVLRVIKACDFGDEYCLISDSDMMPLNLDYFRDNARLAKPDSILFFTSELDGEDKGKYPACYMLARGETFKKYVNPNGLNHYDLLQSWKFGPWADPSQLPFSDESLYKVLFKDAPKICLERHHQHRRLCRSNWTPDPEKLKNHYYIDAHMRRPFNQVDADMLLKSL